MLRRKSAKLLSMVVAEVETETTTSLRSIAKNSVAKEGTKILRQDQVEKKKMRKTIETQPVLFDSLNRFLGSIKD
jgi:hypothetical protein